MENPRRWLDGLDFLLIAALAFAVRLGLIQAFPAIHGGDSIARLAHSDRIVLAYQLPLPQLLVFVTRALAPDPFWTRVVFAAIGSLVPVAIALAARPVLGPDPARIAALLLGLHPLLIHYSTVPYQEGPMLLFLALGAAALVRGRAGWGGFFLGLACLCRYEAWIAAALAVVAHRERPLGALVRFGWAPLVWMAFWRGLSPPGTYVLDLDALARLGPRLPFLFAKLRDYSGDGLLLLGLGGAGLFVRRRDRRIAWAAAGLALLLLVVTLAGQEFPPGSGLVSERLVHVPVVALCLAAGAGGSALAFGAPSDRGATARRGLAVGVLAATIGLGGAWHAAGLAAVANAEPSLHLARNVARFADALLAPGERLTVVGPRLSPEILAAELRKLERRGGDSRAAADLLREFSRRGLDGDRVAAHLARSPRQVGGGDEPGDLYAWFDTPPAASSPDPLPAFRFVAGNRVAYLSRKATR